MKTVVSVHDLRKQYLGAEGQPVEALRGITLSISQGEFVAIMGPSGSGKTTLLHLMAGLDQPTSGIVQIEDTDLSRLDDHQRTLFRRQRLGIIFQSYNLIPTLNALENVILPAIISNQNGASVRKRGLELLNLVDLSHRSSHRPQAMSGGEQQRVAIARAMMMDPSAIFADEPTGNLDTRHGTTIWSTLHRLTRELGRTVVAVTHEAHGAGFADRAIVLKDGVVAGEIATQGGKDAGLVAARYTELVD